MAATQTIAAAAAGAPPSLASNAQRKYNDWRDDFFRDGYYIFKAAVAPEKAQNYYYKKALDWLQSFDNGFDLNNRETWTQEHLPQSFKNMFLGYCAAHEKFVWDARLEPNVIKPFEDLWGTDELIVSFDTLNITLPGRKDNDTRPWPHVDQAPERKGLACVQGLLNLQPAGPQDGGLLLTKGSSALFEEYFETFKARGRKEGDAKHYDFYMFEPEDIEWFKSKGCQEFKVDLDPGDLVLWDSRTIHHVQQIQSDTIRSVIYVCYTPRALAKPEDLEWKKTLFERWEATTHWPHCNIFGQGKAKINGEIDPLERDEPIEKPELTDKVLQLASVKPYHKRKNR